MKTTRQRWDIRQRTKERIEELVDWARSENLATNPDRAKILADRVRKYWIVSRYELCEIVNEVLERIKGKGGE